MRRYALGSIRAWIAFALVGLLAVVSGCSDPSSDASQFGKSREKMTEVNAELADLCRIPSAQQLEELGLGDAKSKGGANFILSQCAWSNETMTLDIRIGSEPASQDPLLAEHKAARVSIDGAQSAVAYEGNLYSDAPWAVTVLARSDGVFVDVEVSGDAPRAGAMEVAKEIAQEMLAAAE